MKKDTNLMGTGILKGGAYSVAKLTEERAPPPPTLLPCLAYSKKGLD